MRRFIGFVLMLALGGAPTRALTNAEALKMFDRMAGKLELSTEQRSAIFFLLVRERNEIRGRLSAEEEARRELRRAIAQPAYDESLVRDRACRVADAELEVSLPAARLYAEVWQKLDPAQRGRVAAAVEGIPARDALLFAAEEFAGSRDLFLTVGK
jgi:Spy/CpxP family protein refolding chaperone